MKSFKQCIDAKGFEGLLEKGECYFVHPLPCGAVKVRSSIGWIVCSRERFL